MNTICSTFWQDQPSGLAHDGALRGRLKQLYYKAVEQRTLSAP